MALGIYEEEDIRAIAEEIRNWNGYDSPMTVKEMKNGVKEVRESGFSDGFSEGRLNGIGEGFSDGFDSGRRSGLEEGFEKGKNTGYAEGLEKGKEIGYEDGKTDGIAEGIEQGKQSMIDESKIIVKQASGIGNLTIGDVSELPHEIQCQLEPLEDKECFDIGNYTIVSDAIAFDISDLAIGCEYIFTSSLPIHWFKISSATYDYNSVIKEFSGAFTEFVFTMARDSRILEHKSQYLFIGITPSSSSAINDTALIKDYNISIRPYNFDVTNKVIKVNDINYTSDENGLVIGIKSSSPNMHFVCSSKMTVTYHQSYGVHLENSRFWDNYQNKRKSGIYQFAFAGEGWTDETFDPHYDMVLASGYSGQQMFWNNQCKDLKAIFERNGVKLDTSKCGMLQQMFQGSLSENLPILDFSSANLSTEYCFMNASVKNIDKIIFSENTKIGSQMFSNAVYLENVIFDGVVCGNVNVQWSTKLSKASWISIMTAASTTASITITGALVSVNKAFETSEGANDGSISPEWLALKAARPNVSVSFI